MDKLNEWIEYFTEYSTDGGGAILDTDECAEILELLIELEHSRKTGINIMGVQ